MSKIKQLRNNPNHSINFAELLENFCPTEKPHLYLSLFIRLIENDNHFKEIVHNGKKIVDDFFFERLHNQNNFIGSTKLIGEKKPDIFYFLISVLSSCNILNENLISDIHKFNEYNQKGLVSKSIHEFNSSEDIRKEISSIDVRTMSKSLEKELIKLYDDDEWFILKPMSYPASKKYGYDTKWCTSAANQSYSFYEYSRKGVLIYVINKINGLKVAVFKDFLTPDGEPSLTFWNQIDNRIDSLETGLPEKIIKIIMSDIKENNVSNSSFSEFINGDENQTVTGTLMYNDRVLGEGATGMAGHHGFTTTDPVGRDYELNDESEIGDEMDYDTVTNIINAHLDTINENLANTNRRSALMHDYTMGTDPATGETTVFRDGINLFPSTNSYLDNMIINSLTERD